MKFLIWSQGHKAWWRPDAMGYTKKRSEAGRYTVEGLSRCILDGADGDTPRHADVRVFPARVRDRVR